MKNKMKKNLFIALGLSICLITPELSASAAPLSNEVFDASFYYNTYPDLQATIGNNESALLDHYIKHGMAEGRYGSAEFNVSFYKNNYADLQAAFGNDYLSYCYHYMTNGKAEGRNASTTTGGTATGQVNTSANKTTVDAVPYLVAPASTVLGTYTTNYDTKVARATNIAIAVSHINGVIVSPGDTFSFSQTVLPRTTANGYVVAPVYINKKVSKGVGGGICQVSSTLYAAMITAGIPATERHAHSLPVSYLPAGWDATISGNSKDLKFKNTYDYSILITASTNSGNGNLTVTLSKVDQ